MSLLHNEKHAFELFKAFFFFFFTPFIPQFISLYLSIYKHFHLGYTAQETLP